MQRLLMLLVAGACAGCFSYPTSPPPIVPSSEAPPIDQKGLPIVPSSEAPPIDRKGQGWSCYKSRDNTSGVWESACFRTLEECRKDMRQYDQSAAWFGPCTPQPQAFCHYIWPSIGSDAQYYCFAEMDECVKHQNHPWLGDRQTACEAMD